MVIGFEDEIACREKHFFDLGILADFLAGCGDDELVVFAAKGGSVYHVVPFEADPGDPHGLHVLIRKPAGMVGVEAGHRGDLVAGEFPAQTGKRGAGIVRAFGIFHHLPKAFHAGVAFAEKVEGRGGKVREQAELVAFGKDHFAEAGVLGENFPRWRAVGRHRREPVGWVSSSRSDSWRSVTAAADENRDYGEERAPRGWHVRRKRCNHSTSIIQFLPLCHGAGSSSLLRRHSFHLRAARTA